MKFKKDITITVEGEIFDQSIDVIELLKSVKLSWKHWWQNDTNWVYGTPSEQVQKGRIDKIILNQIDTNIK